MDRSRLLAAVVGLAAGGLLAAGVLIPAAQPWLLAAATAALGVAISASLAPVVLCLAGLAALGALVEIPPGLLVSAPVVTAALARWRTSAGSPWWAAGPCLVVAACGGAAALAAAGVAWLVAWAVAPGGGRPSRGLITVLNTLCGQSTFVLLCLILPVALPLLLLLPGRRRLMPLLVRWGSRCILYSTPAFRWYCSEQRSRPTAPALLISNHISVLDILAVLAGPGRQRVIFAKPWVFRSLVLGCAARFGGMVPIAQIHDPALAGLLPADADCVIFPEGTRSGDGRTRRFRVGAVQLAGGLGREVALVVHAGAWRVLRPRQLWIRPGVVMTCLLDAPPAAAGWNKAWLNEVRDTIDRAAAAARLRYLGGHLMRLDRWEANAHRGWSAALAWWREERAQVWRLAATAGPETWAVTGDRGGVLREALRQHRPWAERDAAEAACVYRPAPGGGWSVGASTPRSPA